MRVDTRRMRPSVVVLLIVCSAVSFVAGLLFRPPRASSGVGAAVPRRALDTLTAEALPTTRSIAVAPLQSSKTAKAPPLVTDAPSGADAADSPAVCTARALAAARAYSAYADGAAELRQRHGPLRIAAFSRLWVPPLHGTGGMQFHAMHLYSQLAALGHYVHVFVTGPPEGGRTLRYSVDPETGAIREVRGAGERATLVVQQVPSAQNAEYSVEWAANTLQEFARVNASNGGFHVAHSESWAGVPNIYQLGLQMLVTWHGSMLDWFRNELNLVVHNFRMRGKMVGANSVNRMKALGGSVAYEAYMLLAVPRHIVISDAAAADLAAINLVDPNRVTLIYNGVNARNFRPDRGVRAAFLREHAHIPETEQGADLFVVGCGGRLEAIKGHHQLAVAMKLVLARHRNVVLLVAGSGGEGHRYEELARQGLRVHMLGMLPQERLSDFYRSIDVFVDPFYQHHGLNTVMLEAALSGTPIVVTRLASAATTVPCDGGLGLTFTLGSPEELAERLEYLLDHPTERARMGAAARERALLLFTSATMAGRYERALYDAYLHPSPLLPIRGDVVCKRTYPAMCYRTPEVGSETSDAVAEFHRKH